MREGARIQQDIVDLIGLRLLDTIDDFMLGVALECGKLVAQFARKLLQPGFHVREARGAIDARLAATEQI
jgi:hypothetical protein